MNRFRSVPVWLYLVVCLPLLQGCINDDLSMCPYPDNLTLTFRVEAGGIDIARTLNTVDVFLYDALDRFVEHKRAERSDLTIFSGVRFTVTPGEYRVLAWANASPGSRYSDLIPGVSRMEEGYIEMSGAGDTLYYAPARTNAYKGEASLRAAATRADDPYSLYRVVVPKEGGKVVKEVSFTRAYRSVSIYLKGLEFFDAGEITQEIGVEARNLATRYNFLFDTQESVLRNDARAFAGTMTPDGTLPTVRFFSAYGPVTDNMTFTLRNLPDGIRSITIPLREYLMENPPFSYDDIEILVEFLDNVQVNITLPNWSSNPVIPEY
jgi:hypothetical protein